MKPKGAVQTWSKNPKPWKVKYEKNKLSYLKVGLKIAHNVGFYSPDTANEDDTLIDLGDTHTNVTYAYSPVYKKTDMSNTAAEKWILGNYEPENVRIYSVAPVPVNPNNLAIVSPL